MVQDRRSENGDVMGPLKSLPKIKNKILEVQDSQAHPPQLNRCIAKRLSPMPTRRGTGKRDGAVRRPSKAVGSEQNSEMTGGLHTTV